MHRERLGLGAVTLLCALPALALATFQASETKVGFTCIGPGGLHVNGTNDELQ